MTAGVGLSLSAPITVLKGVGPRVAEHCTRLHIHTVQDLLFHLPLRYENRTRISTISELAPGDHVLIEGRITHSAIVGRGRASLVCRLEDDTGVITLRFFHFNAKQKQRLSGDDVHLRCFGEVRQSYSGGLEMMHPEYRDSAQSHELPLEDHLTPVYPTTKGLHQTSFRKLMAQAMDALETSSESVELFPGSVLEDLNLMTLREALFYVHRPPVDASQALLLEGKHAAQQRLALEELVAHQLSLQQLRHRVRKDEAHVFESDCALQERFLAALPFSLTQAQNNVVAEIGEDLSRPHPMLRLVQGDVGCGKTVVAAMAVAQIVAQGFQAAVMAPTEILAEQHLQNFKAWFEPLGIQVAWLSGRQSAVERRDALRVIASGDALIVIGTHALFQNDVSFDALSLIVVDEQHRFGVHQRLALHEKGVVNGKHPHQLVMSATPIPRTLAMTAYADLDCSVIDELPPGRQPVNTVLVAGSRREEVVARVQSACQQQRQAYWICTLIEESEALQCQAAEVTAEELRLLLPDLKIGLVHGRLKSDQKELIMQRFSAGEIDLLIATTVVEVGVDVANASLMIIENPERLGLAQLHQLRGRVGRGDQASYCVLLYKSPLGDIARQRLQIMRETSDGFVIAQKDLEMRGPGEVLGSRQAGLMRFKVADLLRDADLLNNAKKIGEFLCKQKSNCIQPLIERWVKCAERYASV